MKLLIKQFSANHIYLKAVAILPPNNIKYIQCKTDAGRCTRTFVQLIAAAWDGGFWVMYGGVREPKQILGNFFVFYQKDLFILRSVRELSFHYNYFWLPFMVQ